MIPTVLYNGQIDSFSFTHEGTITWSILADVTWDGSSVTLNAHVNTLNDYFVTMLITTFQYDVAVTFCGTRGNKTGSVSDSTSFNLDSERVYDFPCGSFPMNCPSGCSTFTLTIDFTLSSAEFIRSGTFVITLPVPISADVWFILSIIAILIAVLSIWYVVSKRRGMAGIWSRIHRSRVPPEEPAFNVIPPRSSTIGRRSPRAPSPAQGKPLVTPPPAPTVQDRVGDWVYSQLMFARLREEPASSWETLAERHGAETGSCFTAPALKQLYAAWAKTKGIRFEK